METNNPNPITVEVTVNSPVEKVWKVWNEPHHICQWYFASDDWHAPRAENDIKTGWKFKTNMAAKDGSMSFDFEGTYTNVVPLKLIEYSLADGRKVKISFSGSGSEIRVTETFDAETVNASELQRTGWQAIL